MLIFVLIIPKRRLRNLEKKTKLRKPGNLMIKQIYRNWHVDMKKSFMIGDKVTDKMCAKKSNLYFEYPSKDFLQQIKRITKYI